MERIEVSHNRRVEIQVSDVNQSPSEEQMRQALPEVFERDNFLRGIQEVLDQIVRMPHQHGTIEICTRLKQLVEKMRVVLEKIDIKFDIRHCEIGIANGAEQRIVANISVANVEEIMVALRDVVAAIDNNVDAKNLIKILEDKIAVLNSKNLRG
jgi:hypothetical protein